MIELVRECVSALPGLSEYAPRVGIVLGTGLGGLAKKIEVKGSAEYARFPGFPRASVESHAGQLSWGLLGGQRVVAMEGRFHYYEGYSLQEITFPIRVMKALGVEILLVSNASGGLNPNYKGGDIVAIEDHINFFGANPLIGPNFEELGPRFPDMIEPYSHRLIELFESCAIELGKRVHRGVYIGVPGPCLETRAEYRMMRALGADLVGMSTVPEVIVAVHSGLEVLGLSIVTDMCLPDALEPADIGRIIATASRAEPELCRIVMRLLEKLNDC
ncbi:MAG: purine-nucleoside phosphorylase [Planctomycetes bacterium]|nr:purine-nucleoside phosphorylase [Planctomycetota bacterium]